MTKPSKSSLKHYVLDTETGYIHATPYGFNIYAADFLDAAKQFKTSRPFSPVPYYLLCHSIELSLKCFLLGKKAASKEELKKREWGHYFGRLMKRASELEIDSLVTITPEHLSA